MPTPRSAASRDVPTGRCGRQCAWNSICRCRAPPIRIARAVRRPPSPRASPSTRRSTAARRASGSPSPCATTRPTTGAQCHGTHRFAIAFEPHGPAPTAGALVASARDHTIPPRVVTARARGGTAPLTRSFLRVERDRGGAVLSALKRAEDRPSVIVRLFNPDSADADLALVFDAPIAEAYD